MMSVPQLPDDIWETIFSSYLEHVYPIMFNRWSYDRLIHNVTDLDWLVAHGFIAEYGNGPEEPWEEDWTPSEDFWF